jgi:hypothetical protein
MRREEKQKGDVRVGMKLGEEGMGGVKSDRNM